MDVEAINLTEKVAVLNNGTLVPITTFLDSCGMEVDATEAVSGVCGSGSEWFVFVISDFERTLKQ